MGIRRESSNEETFFILLSIACIKYEKNNWMFRIPRISFFILLILNILLIFSIGLFKIKSATRLRSASHLIICDNRLFQPLTASISSRMLYKSSRRMVLTDFFWLATQGSSLTFLSRRRAMRISSISQASFKSCLLAATT